MKKEIVFEDLMWKNKLVKLGKYMKLEDKMRVANELVLERLVMDEGNGVLYETPLFNVFFIIRIIEEYTDIKVPKETEKRVKLYDALREDTETMERIIAYLDDEINEIADMIEVVTENTKAAFNAQNNIGTKMEKMLNGLDADTLTEAIAQNEEFLNLVRKTVTTEEITKPRGKILQFPTGITKKDIEE